jgi:hypothetical protein
MDYDKIINHITSNYISILSAIAAILSALYAFRSNLISKKALAIAQQDHLNKQSNFGIYIIDAFRYKSKEQEKKFLMFNVTINNKSEIRNSFKSTLQIEFIRPDNSVARVLIDHSPVLKTSISKADITAFPVDIKMEEKGIETSWLLFEEPSKVFNEFRIEKFTIKLIDIHGNSKAADISIIKDIDYETKKN